MALACSFGPRFELFQHRPSLATDTNVLVEKPSMKIISIERGSDDGNFASCSDAGVITIQLSTKDVARLPYTGYVFTLIKGELEEEQPIFPDYAIQPIQKIPGIYKNDKISFVWLDGSSNIQESINLKISVTAINARSVESKPQIISIENNGNTVR